MASRKRRVQEAISQNDVEALNRKRRQERSEKYPECEKLSLAGDTRRELNAFLEWLRAEKKLELCDSAAYDRNGYLEPIANNDETYDKIVLEYLEVDPKKLEDERRAMLDALQESVE